MSLQKRVSSFRFAIKGLADLFKTQPNARVHLVATVWVLGAGIYFHVSRTEWIALALCVAMVVSMEAMNTAIEHVVDLVSPDFHPLAGRAKDVAAAAVLLAAMGAVAVGGIVFLPKILGVWGF